MLATAPGIAAPIAFVPATSRADVVFDRYNVLHVSNADRLIRYDVRRDEMLADIVVSGANLRGLDIDPTGCHIVAADGNAADSTTLRIWILRNGSNDATDVRFARMSGEGGTHAVAFVDASSLYVTSDYQGSGSTPLRRVSLADGSTQELRTISENSMIAVSRDGRYYAYSESNISSGPVRLGDTGTNDILSSINTDWFMFEIAISPDGSVIFAPSYGGGLVFDRVGSQLSQRAQNIGAYAFWSPIGMAFATHTPAVFASMWSWSSADPHGVVVFDDASFDSMDTLHPHQFGWVGNGSFNEGRMKLSSDGRYLAVTVANGVAVYDVASHAADVNHVFSDSFDGCSPL